MSIVKPLFDLLVHAIRRFSWLGVLVTMIMESACLPIPSEIVMPLAGFALCSTIYDLIMGTLIGSLANLIGSWIAYIIGLYGGRPFLLKYGKYLLIGGENFKRAEDFFNKYGEIAVFVGRILPAIRTFISLPAGIFSMNPTKFTLYTFIGSLPWNFLLIYAGFKLGEYWYIIEEYMRYLDIVLVCLILILLIYLIRERKSQ